MICVSMICVSMIGPSFAPVWKTFPEVFLDPYGLPDCQARRRGSMFSLLLFLIGTVNMEIVIIGFLVVCARSIEE
jgi:hypothetical protein